MSTPVNRDQFEVTDTGVVHKPTGAEFKAHPDNPSSGSLRLRRLGDKLPSGEDYRPREVEDMIQKLWAEQLSKRISKG